MVDVLFREDFVEDINNILNTGEVPNLYENDMKNEIIETLRKPCAAAVGHNDSTSKEILTYFVEQIKAHLHIVLAFSPVSEQFRKRLLMFPSLINCCTIDWFDKWPTEALQSVRVQLFVDHCVRCTVHTVRLIHFPCVSVLCFQIYFRWRNIFWPTKTWKRW